jgi:hypothetical protein
VKELLVCVREWSENPFYFELEKMKIKRLQRKARHRLVKTSLQNAVFPIGGTPKKNKRNLLK